MQSPEPLPKNNSDDFDRLPDPIILTILNNISDIKTLIRCRSVSRRFNSLVPQSDSLLLRVDRVISSIDSDDNADTSSVITFIKSVIKSLHNLIKNNSDSVHSEPEQSEYSPAMILRGFDKIKELEIELPSGDLWLEKRAVVKWRAEFGKTLRSCVILGFRCGVVGESDLGGGGGLKTRVVWTISALIAASARHFMVKQIVTENVDLMKLIVKDREDEGIVVMNELGIEEYREDISESFDEQEGQNGNCNGNDGGVWWRSNRTKVPAVWMRMRHEARLELSNGVVMEGATLVVVRPAGNGGGTAEEEEEERQWDEGLADGGGFDGVYGEAVAKLISRRSYLLEMNSF